MAGVPGSRGPGLYGKHGVWKTRGLSVCGKIQGSRFFTTKKELWLFEFLFDLPRGGVRRVLLSE